MEYGEIINRRRGQGERREGKEAQSAGGGGVAMVIVGVEPDLEGETIF
jgi:hypothetical protein